MFPRCADISIFLSHFDDLVFVFSSGFLLRIQSVVNSAQVHSLVCAEDRGLLYRCRNLGGKYTAMDESIHGT